MISEQRFAGGETESYPGIWGKRTESGDSKLKGRPPGGSIAQNPPATPSPSRKSKKWGEAEPTYPVLNFDFYSEWDEPLDSSAQRSDIT